MTTMMIIIITLIVAMKIKISINLWMIISIIFNFKRKFLINSRLILVMQILNLICHNSKKKLHRQIILMILKTLKILKKIKNQTIKPHNLLIIIMEILGTLIILIIKIRIITTTISKTKVTNNSSSSKDLQIKILNMLKEV